MYIDFLPTLSRKYIYIYRCFLVTYICICIKLYVSCAEYCLFNRALLQKRPIVCRFFLVTYVCTCIQIFTLFYDINMYTYTDFPDDINMYIYTDFHSVCFNTLSVGYAKVRRALG